MPNLSFVTDDINVAKLWLKQGKLLAYPTESVWGLGCDAFNKQAIEHLLVLKNRPKEKGLIVLTADVSYIQEFTKPLLKKHQSDIIKSWQGGNQHQQATTWLFDVPLHVDIPKWLMGEYNTLAIRIINHNKIAKLCESLVAQTNPYGFLVSTSCNVTGFAPAHDFEMAFDYFGEQVYYLLGRTLGYHKPSIIKNATTGQLLRA